MIQALFKEVNRNDEKFQSLQANLLTVQQESKELPPGFEIAVGLFTKRSTNKAIAGSKMYDIYEGLYLGKEKCAIKVIRGVNTSAATRERFTREANNWRAVYSKEKGQYVLPLFGVCYDDGQWPCLISPWMENGNAINYMKLRDEEITKTHRIRFITRIAEGIRVLHSLNIAHGQIRGTNILVDHFGDPKLGDFGLSKVVADIEDERVPEVSGMSDSWRWFAPETITGGGNIILESDIYSYAMTVLELMTHKRPFAMVPTRRIAIVLLNKERPERPDEPEVRARGLDNKLWAILQRCWAEEAEDRPKIEEVLAELSK